VPSSGPRVICDRSSAGFNELRVNLAQRYFGHTSPVGQSVRLLGNTRWLVVGVVEDMRQHLLTQEPVPALFVDATEAMTRRRFYAVLLGTFAGIAGVLAAVGIYGVLAFAVVQRTREIGIRVALGAQRGDVVQLVMQRGILLTDLGVALGTAGAVTMARLLSSLLFGLTPLDPLT
jgi:ABC-type antimicrobial peptide transport system permease subunit